MAIHSLGIRLKGEGGAVSFVPSFLVEWRLARGSARQKVDGRSERACGLLVWLARDTGAACRQEVGESD